MSKMFEIDASAIDALHDQMKRYGSNASKVIESALRTDGYDTVNKSIISLLPESGRMWPSRRTAPASSTDPFEEIDELLGFTIKSTKEYNYLYFPDDGSNTVHHRGGQQFMKRGADAVMNDLVEMIETKLIESF